MAEKRIAEVIDEAQLVRATDLGSQQVIQVWYGGVTVNVFTPVDQGVWTEVDAWTFYDDEGRPVERNEMERMMEQHEELMKEESR